MKNPRTFLFGLGAWLAVAGVPSLVHAADIIVFTKLDGFQEVPPISTKGNGEFAALILGNSVRYSLSYRALEGGAVQFAHLHFGRTAVNGGVMAFLCSNVAVGVTTPPCPPPTGGTVTGTLTAANVIGPAGQGIAAGEFAEFVRALQNESAYANVHTAGFPAGEIRGDIEH